MSNAWHSKAIESVLDELQTDPLGLESGEIRERLEKYGPNKLVERKGTSALQIC